MELRPKRNVSPTEAVKILAKHGTVVTIEQAKVILDFMYNFGKLSIEQQIRNIKNY